MGWLGHIILIAALSMGCSSPPAPKPPQPSVVGSAKSAGEASQAANSGAVQAEVALLGAKVGPAELQKQVNDCNVAGSYFNRTTALCESTIKLAPFKCDEASLRAANTLRPTEVEDFNGKLKPLISNADPVQNYLFDQCILPTTPDPTTGKTYRLKIYMAREMKDAKGSRIEATAFRFDP